MMTLSHELDGDIYATIEKEYVDVCSVAGTATALCPTSYS